MTLTKEERSSQAIATDPHKALYLAPNFQPDVDLLTSEGLITFGVKGSGKSNLVGLLAEELGRFYLPQVILDTEREYQSLVNYLPHGIIGNANRCPSGYDILHKGLQVILDLRSWDSDEAAGLAMCQLIGELFTVSGAQAPQDRVPCIIHLDEASYWLPQDSVTYLSKEARKALTDAFHKLASRGRKQGLTPFLYTQNISEVRKETIRHAGVQVLMRQVLDIDLARYCEYVRNATSRTRATIRAFGSGKAIVLLPDGTQRLVQFHQRASEHVSQTPTTQMAMQKFAELRLDAAAIRMRDLSDPSAEKAPPRKLKTAPTLRERVFTLLKRDRTLTARELAATLGCPQNTAQIYRTEYFTLAQLPKPVPPSIMEENIQALLAENPYYSPSQIAHRTNYSLGDVRRILARIQSQAQQGNA